MEIELVPDPGPDDPVSQAAVAALVQEDLIGDRRPASYDGAWRRAGLLDGVEREAALDGSAAGSGYVLPARNTAGATRA